jgi:cytochrome c553
MSSMNFRISLAALLCTLLCAIAVVAQEPQTSPNGLPAWAYNVPDKVQPQVAEATGTVRLPGSSRQYVAKETESTTNPPDWFPEEHGPAPKIVKGAVGSSLMACGSCHLMSGQGHPESADLAGLPADYIVRQMAYFKSGARKDPARMNVIAKVTPDEDVRQAAEYFAASKPRVWVRVQESDHVPKTYVSNRGRTRLLHPDGGTEPIASRIIEVPEDASRSLNRDPHSAFVAYVPPGSIKKGEVLVKTGGNGRTIQCAICHGLALSGLGDVPRIGGLQPVYIARQLIDIQNGSSAGKGVELMRQVVAKLTDDDVIAISAYVGSLQP